jgi:cytochrome c-type biogenesis protein CcmH/NrfG
MTEDANPQSETRNPKETPSATGGKAVGSSFGFRVWFFGALAVVVVLGGGLAWWWWPRTPRVEPPSPDLTEVDEEVAEAIAAARDKVKRRPADGRAWGGLGMVFRAHDFADEANRSFREAERLDPAEPRWPYLLGLSVVMTDPAAGIPCLERAVERSGDDPLAPRMRLAEALLEQGRLDEARGHLERARRREPDNRRVRLGLGRLAVLRGQWRAALDELEHCTDDPHSRKMAHTLRAEAHTRLHETDKAREEQRLAEAAPEDVIWPDPFVGEVLALQCGLRFRLQRAADLLELRRFAEAVWFLEATLKRYPESLTAWLQLGVAWQNLGRMDQAEQAYRRAVDVDPDSADAWFRLGCVQALRRPQDAAESFRRTIALKPDHALAHFNLGHRLRELGDAAGAADEFRAALRARPDYAPARDALRELEKKKKESVP